MMQVSSLQPGGIYIFIKIGILEKGSDNGFFLGWCRLICLCAEGQIDSVYSVTNSWDDISRTLLEKSPAFLYSQIYRIKE